MIYVDCSLISREPHKQSGIQRVTRNIAKGLRKISPKVRWAVLGPDMNFYELKSLPQPADSPFSHMGERLYFQNNDVYLVLDSTWDRKILERLLPFKLKGLTIGVTYYDLFPITHPEFSGIPQDFFESWVTETLKYGDFFACISKATANELHRVGAQKYPAWKPDKKCVFSFPLGADFAAPGTSYAPKNELLRKAFDGGKTYLLVSTLEPRKNHALALDAFEMLWETLADVKLCFIGSYGWDMEKFAAKLSAHPMKDKRFFWLNDLNDADVAWAYKQAKCVICPSFAEGFGLPILEALHHGSPVLASDLPVFHEIAGDRIGYFNPQNKHELADRVQRLEYSVPSFMIPEESFRWPTWNEGARILLDKMTFADAHVRAKRASGKSEYRDIFKFPPSVKPADALVGVSRISREAARLKKEKFSTLDYPHAQSHGLIHDRVGLMAFLAPYEETLKNMKQFEQITPEWEIQTHRKLLAPFIVGVKKLLRRMLRSFVASGWERQSVHNRELNLMVDALFWEIANLRTEVGRLKAELDASRTKSSP